MNTNYQKIDRQYKLLEDFRQKILALQASNNSKAARIGKLEAVLGAYVLAHDADEMENDYCECDLCMPARALLPIRQLYERPVKP